MLFYNYREQPKRSLWWERNCLGESSLQKSSRAIVGGPWAATDALGSQIPESRFAWCMHFLCFSLPTMGPCTAPACLCLCDSVFMYSCLSTVRNRPTHESRDYAVISAYWRKANPWTSYNQERCLGEDGVQSPAHSSRSLLTLHLPGICSPFCLVYLFLDQRQPPWPNSAFLSVQMVIAA